MALPLRIDDQAAYDKLDPIEQKHFVKADDGHWYFQGIESGGLEVLDPSKLTNALNTERATITELKRELHKFDGVDPERYTSMERQLADLGDDATIEAKAAALAEQKVAQLVETHASALDEEKTRGNKYRDRLRKVEVTDNLVRMLEAAGAKGVNAQALAALMRERDIVGVEENDDGAFTMFPRAAPGGGPKVGSDGQNVTMESWVETLPKDQAFGSFFTVEPVDGTDGPKAPAPGVIPVEDRMKMDPAARISAARAQQGS